ncbi:hypothetical protein GM160_00710 [Guyparkeria halophila]|uniref:Uncharacterized protein n=1 Tax=Guyparkeria halophila TaxID=47960 RepID=A0A6I6CY35_9GAMM|nr:hypothetical protein [Guyparkeria halophila]QGT77518.1 hypothetical protein GM160_00710 [Guyparkeria halophila]
MNHQNNTPQIVFLETAKVPIGEIFAHRAGNHPCPIVAFDGTGEAWIDPGWIRADLGQVIEKARQDGQTILRREQDCFFPISWLRRAAPETEVPEPFRQLIEKMLAGSIKAAPNRKTHFIQIDEVIDYGLN